MVSQYIVLWCLNSLFDNGGVVAGHFCVYGFCDKLIRDELSACVGCSADGAPATVVCLWAGILLEIQEYTYLRHHQ